MSCRPLWAVVTALFSASLCANFAIPTQVQAQDECRHCGPATGRCGPGVNCLPPDQYSPDLFYNFYVGPNCGGVPAELYPAPYPTPPLVGHTYYTYQPLMPHEMLYRHQRVYRQYYNYGRGVNRTTVRWW